MNNAYRHINMFYNKNFITKRNKRHTHFKKKNVILFQKKDTQQDIDAEHDKLKSLAKKSVFRLTDIDTI